MKRLVFILILLQSSCFSQQPKFLNYFASPRSTSLAIENEYLWIGTPLALIRFNTVTSEKEFFQAFNCGLPGNYIRSIVVDKQGIKWIGTGKGLARYDGKNWTVFNKSNSGLPDDDVWSVAIDSSGNKWIGTRSAGLAKFDGQNWTVYNKSNSGLTDSEVLSVAFDRNGKLWVGTVKKGIFSFDGQNWNNFNVRNSSIADDFISSIVVDNENNIWTASERGTCFPSSFSKFDGNKWITLNDTIVKLGSNSQGIISIATRNGISNFQNKKWELIRSGFVGLESVAVDSKGNQWVTTNGGLLLRFDGKDWKSFNLSNSALTHNGINSIAIDQEDKAWIGPGNFNIVSSLTCLPLPVSFDGKSWEILDTIHCPAFKNQILAIAKDKDRTIWFGTSDGLIHFDGTNWKTYDHSNSKLPSDFITSIAVDPSGKKWIGTDKGLAMFDGKDWEINYASSFLMPECCIKTLAAGNDGMIWAGIKGKGLMSYNGRGNWSFYNSSKTSLPLSTVNSIAIDAQGGKWIAMECGELVYLKGACPKVYRPTSAKYSPDFTSIAIDKQGNKWLGSLGRFYKFDGENWTEFDFENFGMPYVSVSTIAIDSQDNLWIGTRHNDIFPAGLIIFNEKGVNLAKK